jgi:hypothetical protein
LHATAAVLGVVTPLAIQAQSQFADALRRSNFTVFSGDVNSDGYVDLLLKASQGVVMIPLDDLFIPIVIQPLVPTFAIMSDGSGGYYLDASPSAQILNSPVWQPGTHDLVYGDLLGNGGASAIIEARNPGAPSFSVATSTSNGAPQLLQHLTPSAIGVDLGGAGITTELKDINGDGRSDLLIKTDGTVTDALVADASGILSREEDSPILATWYAVTAALSASDLNAATQYFTIQAAPTYLNAFAARGNLPGLAASWSPIQPVIVAENYATFVFTHTDGSIQRLHFVGFVKEGGRWVIASL